ncbi:MAG: ribose-phosphate diphosphokinase [Haloquadratum sp.]|nr:ribose-phosphate diphosphokinase [Haloquadratum sp.]
MIVPGHTAQGLAAAVATATQQPLAGVAYDRFPDGELCHRITTDELETAVVVAAADSSDAIVGLLQLQDAARELAGSVTTVLSYMGYARQDRAFSAGEPVSARALAAALSTGTDQVVLINPHEASVTDFFAVPTMVCDVTSALAAAIDPAHTDPLVVAPDASARPMAVALCEALGRGEVDHVEKTRHSATRVELSTADLTVTDRTVVLVDDIISTGTTMATAAAQLLDAGATRVDVACVHGLLAGAAQSALVRSGVTEIITTDTLDAAPASVSVAEAVAGCLSAR